MAMQRPEQERYRLLLQRLADETHRRLADADTTQPVAPDRAIGRLTRMEAMQARQMSLAVRRRQQEELGRIASVSVLGEPERRPAMGRRIGAPTCP
jgi:hypothetical protein